MNKPSSEEAATGSAPNPRQLLENEARRRRVVVEDEWQTSEDCLDDGRLGDAVYFLERMIAEAKRLKRCIEAAETLGPNGRLPRAGLDDLPGMMQLAQGVRDQRWPHTVDARVWADEWKRTLAEHPSIATDKECMVDWFANAIMAGYDTASLRSSNDRTHLPRVR